MFLILRSHALHLLFLCLLNFFCFIFMWNPFSNQQHPVCFISSFKWIRFCTSLTCLKRKFISKGSLMPQELLGVSLCNNCSHNLEFTISILWSIIPVPPIFGGRLFLDGLLNKYQTFLRSPFNIHLTVNDEN